MSEPQDVLHGDGSPEGVVTAGPLSLYRDDVNKVVYMKSSGEGDTGWKVWAGITE